MLGRNGNIAYVRYDHQGRIVPGGPIIQARPPKVGNWQAVSNVIGNNWVGPSGTTVLRAFVRIDAFNRVVPSSLLLLNKKPEWVNDNTTWLEINAQYRGNGISTTTTTSTTTTFSPVNFNITLTCNGTINTFSGNTPTGGSGTYEFTGFWYTTEQDALNATTWNPPNVSALYTGMNNDTYWIACRDANNTSNIIAKSVVANCQPISTTTTTTTTQGGQVGVDGFLKYEVAGFSTPFKILYSEDGVNWSGPIFNNYVGGYPNGNLYSPIAAGHVGTPLRIRLTDMSDVDIKFGVGLFGSYDTYCGTANPYIYTPVPPNPPYAQSIYVNVAVSAGNFVYCN